VCSSLRRHGIGLRAVHLASLREAPLGASLHQDACQRAGVPYHAYPVAADVGHEDDIRHLVGKELLDLYWRSTSRAPIPHRHRRWHRTPDRGLAEDHAINLSPSLAPTRSANA